MFQTSAFNVLKTFQIVNQVDLLRFDWNKVNFHCDNVSKITLSLQHYYMFQASVLRTFEIEKSCGHTSVRLEQGKSPL